MELGKWIFKKITDYLGSDSGEDRHSYLCDFDRIGHEIIPGDVLLIEGTNRISKLIKQITHSPWTHAALYIGRLHSIEDPELRQIVRNHYHGPAGKQLVVESLLGKGTIIAPLSSYKNHHIRICRPTGIAHSDSQSIIGFAIRHVGHTYNMRHILDLARFYLGGWLLPKRWKSSLFTQEDPGQTTQDICSAMIAAAFTSIKFPILPLVREDDDHKIEMIHRNPKLYTPSDFDYSPYFAIIKYPIFSISGYSPYRNLPWREGLMSDDEGVVSRLHSPPKKENEEET